jgi:hypothetical protein
MSSSFSDKPYSSRHDPEHALDGEEPAPRPPQIRREPGMRINYRRLLAGFASLFIVAGFLLLCFIRGGLANPHRHWDGSSYIELNDLGHIFGFVLLGLGASMFVFLFSLEKR